MFSSASGSLGLRFEMTAIQVTTLKNVYRLLRCGFEGVTYSNGVLASIKQCRAAILKFRGFSHPFRDTIVNMAAATYADPYGVDINGSFKENENISYFVN